MATPTYDLLASQVLSTSAASVSFTSIPATYRDLVLVINGTDSATVPTGVSIRFNADTSNVNSVYARNDFSNGSGSKLYVNASAPSGKNMIIAQIMDYAQTDKHKVCLSRSGSVPDYVWMAAGRWASTSAINEVSLHIDESGANFNAGTSISLYGIA